MPINLFKPDILSLGQVLDNPNFEIPTFQRDVVWTAPRMLTLIDSVYRGIPINSLYLWHREGVRMKDGSESDAETQLVIDGQQRLTALKAMLLGKPYYRNGRAQHIKVAFHPIEGTFRKVDNQFCPSDKHVPNIAAFYADPAAETTAYENRNERKLTAEEKETVAANLKRLQAIKTLPIAIYQISNTATLEQVYLCFERTNTGGTKVSKADLCLAWLEAYQPLLAEGITLFSQGIQPRRQTDNIRKPSREFNRSRFAKAIQWIQSIGGSSVCYHPKAGHVADLLFDILQDGKKFNLGTIARQLLSDTGNASAQAENQARVDSAFLEIVNKENFNRFNQILSQFPGINLTDSNYAYWLFLRCRRESSQKGYTGEKIARLLQRWYLLQLLSSISVTGAVPFSRYLPGFAQGGGLEGYLRTLETDLPEDFWTEQLSNGLLKEERKARKIARAWEMVQILDPQRTITALFDAAVPIGKLQSSQLRSRHHLYPQELLRSADIPESQINAIANFALTTKEVNSRIGNRTVDRFIEDMEERGVLWNAQEHLEAHCIPSGAGTLPYEAFLEERAKLMAARIQEVYEALKC